MKKLFAILLLSVYLFNLAGYSLFFRHLITESDFRLTEKLDSHQYSDRDLVEVKVPLHMPYISNTGDFERIDGQLEYQGIQYNYVRRKIANDTLYVMCLPNVSKTNLYSARGVYAKEANDIPAGKKGSDTGKKSESGNEYSCQVNQYHINSLSLLSVLHYPFFSEALQDSLSPTPGQPPKAFG